MRLLPSKRVCEKFWIIYEMKGCQKAVDFLTRHYEIRRMRIVLAGKKVGNSYVAHYEHYTAYFKKTGLIEVSMFH